MSVPVPFAFVEQPPVQYIKWCLTPSKFPNGGNGGATHEAKNSVRATEAGVRRGSAVTAESANSGGAEGSGHPLEAQAERPTGDSNAVHEAKKNIALDDALDRFNNQ